MMTEAKGGLSREQKINLRTEAKVGHHRCSPAAIHDSGGGRGGRRRRAARNGEAAAPGVAVRV
jgi:hypothetical protein